ncbi:hypothetical protein DICVIV_12461 [Dictyocaulus viviparus]|uniref:G-protein coupled receptors family 2 profile 2 domain-containing protein n=1 Tax=Dictyocaulus viviparus TaxID=29172 RepID=A0A0D8XAG4_DICVI|nr:hypothetical protein DICVIV_12461 [Dictyocaulus viviparus]
MNFKFPKIRLHHQYFRWSSTELTSCKFGSASSTEPIWQEAHVKLIAGMIAFSISVICLIPATFILWFFRSMRNQSMFIVHRHLLISFLLSGLFYLFNCFFFIVDGAPGDKLIFANHISCRILFLIQLRFLRLATFSWMLAEGVFLFRLLQSDRTDGDNLTVYKFLCWGQLCCPMICFCFCTEFISYIKVSNFAVDKYRYRLIGSC